MKMEAWNLRKKWSKNRGKYSELSLSACVFKSLLKQKS